MTEPPPRTRLRTEDGATQRAARSAVLDDIVTWDDMGMFHSPVSDEDAPGYSSVIKQPMDLSTIRRKNEEGRYDSASDAFAEDLLLMVSNALQFNKRGSVWHRHAKELKRQLGQIFEARGVVMMLHEGEEGDTVYLPTVAPTDSESTLAREEKRKGAEDISNTLDAMKADLNLSVAELRAKYARPTTAAAEATPNEDDTEEEELEEADTEEAEEDDDTEEEESGSSTSAESSVH